MEIVFNETRATLNDYVETLSILIENYEEEHFPMKKANSLEVLKLLSFLSIGLEFIDYLLHFIIRKYCRFSYTLRLVIYLCDEFDFLGNIEC